jgi:hypothetical protein
MVRGELIMIKRFEKGQKIHIKVTDAYGKYIGDADATFVKYEPGTRIMIVRQGKKLFEIDDKRDWWKNMALRDWSIHSGWESPGWYNISIIRRAPGKHRVQEIILSAAGDDEGSNNPDVEWIMGLYDEDRQPISGGSTRTFANKAACKRAARIYMRRH